MGYTPNYSHLVGIMIINHWVQGYTIFRQTHIVQVKKRGYTWLYTHNIEDYHGWSRKILGKLPVLNTRSCYSDELQFLWEHGVRSWIMNICNISLIICYEKYVKTGIRNHHKLWWTYRSPDSCGRGAMSMPGSRPWKIGKRPPLTRSGNCRRRGCEKSSGG